MDQVDVGALFGEYGEVEAISLRAGDVDSARGPSIDVRFAHVSLRLASFPHLESARLTALYSAP